MGEPYWPPRWHRAPRPNAEVVEIFEQALEAARQGRIRWAEIIVVNPLHEVESASAGERHEAFMHAAVSGLMIAARKLLRRLEERA